MKATTGEWFKVAEDDLNAARLLINDEQLTSLAAFHCQQCIEKCLKAVLEENDLPFIKSHDLIRLNFVAGIPLTDHEKIILEILNEVYIDSRYPGDAGLLPQGKPAVTEISNFIGFCDALLRRIKHLF